jgi:glycerophosphoryl diester phosphodiesterase
MTMVIAHRGARSLAPENTLVAARLACSMGAHMWETDVSITADKQLILFHDPTLDRCTDVGVKFSGRSPFWVHSFTLEEIQTLDAGSNFILADPFGQIAAGQVDSDLLPEFKAQRIPTLAQGLSLVKELNWVVNLELKSDISNPNNCDLVDLALSVIGQSGIDLNRVIISSFNHDWLRHVMDKTPEIEVQALVGDDLDTEIDFGDFSFDAYNANAVMITPEQIVNLKSMGKKINLFTVNDPDEFFRFSSLGVDGMFTDFPQRFCIPRSEQL